MRRWGRRVAWGWGRVRGRWGRVWRRGRVLLVVAWLGAGRSAAGLVVVAPVVPQQAPVGERGAAGHAAGRAARGVVLGVQQGDGLRRLAGVGGSVQHCTPAHESAGVLRLVRLLQRAEKGRRLAYTQTTAAAGFCRRARRQTQAGCAKSRSRTCLEGGLVEASCPEKHLHGGRAAAGLRHTAHVRICGRSQLQEATHTHTHTHTHTQGPTSRAGRTAARKELRALQQVAVTCVVGSDALLRPVRPASCRALPSEPSH